MLKNKSTQQIQSAGNFCLGDFKSLKELRKSKEIPKFKFSSEVVKDLLDQKSMMYLPSLH